MSAAFESIPSGLDIAHYFWDETEHRNPGCDGIDLYAEDNDYCYLWVEAMVDLDMWEAYLLDVRTKVGENETRDFLFLFVGAGGRFDVEWHNQPVDFSAAYDPEAIPRFRVGLEWLANLTEKAVEDADEAATKRGLM